MSPANAFLALNALVFAGLGLAGMFAPEAVLAGVGAPLASGASTIDPRATYGGAMLGVAVFLAACMGGTRVRTGVLAVAILMLGFLLGRVVGLLSDGGPALMWQLALFEAFWAALASWLYLRYPQQQRA